VSAILRLTVTGVTSRMPHLMVYTMHDGLTVVYCCRCGQSLRQVWPESLSTAEEWAQQHRHDGDEPAP